MAATGLAGSVLAAPSTAAAATLATSLDQATRSSLVEELAAEVLRLIRVDPQQALVVAERQAAIACGHERLEARATWSRAHALVNLARPAEAADHYARAAVAYRHLGDPVVAARTALGHVDALMYLGRYDEAITVGKSARRVLQRHGEVRSLFRLDTNLANILHRVDRPAAALRAYDRALASARGLGDEAASRWIRFNRANVLTSLGRYERADATYREVRQEAESAGETRVVALVDYSLGYLRLQRSEYGQAFATLDSARAAFESLGDAHYLALCHLDLAELFLEINSFVRARQQASRARSLFSRAGLRYESAKATLFLGVATLGLGDDKPALLLLREAARAFRREGNRVSEALCGLYAGEVARRAGQVRLAENRFRAAEERFAAEKFRLRAAAAALRRARLAIQHRERVRAERHLGDARRFLRGLDSPWLRAQHDHLRGRIHLQEGRFGPAFREVRRAIDGIETARRRIGLDEFRVSYAADKAPVYADMVEIILRSRPGPRAVSESFAVVERARSRALVDLLAGRLAGAGDRLDPAGRRLLSRLDQLKGELSWLAGAELGEPGRRNEARLARSRAALRAREAEIADIMQRLARRSADLGALTQGETITLQDVQSRLTAGSVLVEYYLAGEEARAFIVEKDRARVVTLDGAPAEIAAAIERLRFQIEKWGYGDAYARGREALFLAGVRHHLDKLAELVWRPLDIDAGRLVIVPHGCLHSLPFPALPVDDRGVKDGGKVLVDQAEITILPSASTIRYLRQGAYDDESPSALVIGVEDERIPKVREEVERVRSLFPGARVLRNREATLTAFATAAPTADFLHIAAHGIFREDDPHFSALRLADGWLSLYDLYALRLRARLAVLSACQSGRSWVGGGDEMVGLVRGFLFAGAESLLVSLWPVHDTTTADLMGAFYRALRQGEPASAALRSAMRAVRDEHPHPYHWASFTLIGPGGALAV